MSADAPSHGRNHPPKVLVVDDSAVSRMALGHTLRKAGFEPVLADSAEAARTYLKEDRPALILMDVQMPGTDGYTFTAELKSDPGTASIPIVIQTLRSLAVDREMAFAAGCDEYIAKPSRPEQLIPLLRRIISATASTDAS
ncbi:MAG: response regulator [Candidatus Dormibacteria bacterium]